MFISHKSNVIQHIYQTEWKCRMRTKGMSTDEYWAWLESVTTDGVADYSGETGYTIVECTDENVQARLVELGDYISRKPEGETYNIKYYASKRDAEEILDSDGKSHDPKQYVQSHFSGDDTAKDARLLADKWVDVRRDRDRKLADTDFHALSDATLADNMKTYRQALRDVPSQSDPDNITWPVKP